LEGALSRGGFYATHDGGVKWTLLAEIPLLQVVAADSEKKEYLPRIEHSTFNMAISADKKHGYLSDDYGLLASEDGGAHWRRRIFSIGQNFRDIGSWKYENGAPVALPRGNTITLPPPWTWVLMLASVTLSIPYFRIRQRKTEDVVLHKLSSDEPIKEKGQDQLGFSESVSALSHYLRNPSTEPPLTLAITGDWGMGKSSLMRLLEMDLTKRGWRTVWFNPWHHQAGENLLAPLLAQIIEKGVPPLWHPRGWRFRCRLVWIRGKRQLVVLVTLAGIFVFFLSYLAHVGPMEREGTQSELKWLTDSIVTLTKPFVEAKDSRKETTGLPNKEIRAPLDSKLNEPADISGGAKKAVSSVAVVTSLISLCVALRRGFKAFGVDVGSIAKLEPAVAKPSALRAQAGFRYRFSEQFNDVTEAMAPETMIIFIDDLDRCTPSAVLASLEAVNFLVTAGRCFVVLGMAEERVLPCIKKGLADAGLTPAPGESTESLAVDYLEKLVNLRFAVPRTDTVNAMRLFTNDNKNRWEKWVHMWVPVAAIMLLIASALAIIWVMPGWFVSTPAATLVARKVEPTLSPATPALSPRSPPATEPPAAEARHLSPTATLASAQNSLQLDWLGMFGIGVLVVLAGWRLARSPRMFSESSPDFVDELRKCTPLIVSRRATPRALKRFLNHLRFLDARQSARKEIADSPLASWFHLLGWWKKVNAVDNRLGARDLVRIATLFYAFRGWHPDEPLPPIFRDAVGEFTEADKKINDFNGLAEGTSFFRAVREDWPAI
jgi:hypothetical protein